MILTEKNLEKYLKEKNFIKKREKISIKSLSGGWLNPLFLVKTKNKSFVVKQTADKGKKECGLDNWQIHKERMLNEYFALKICKLYAPENIPGIIGVDFENFVQIIEYIENSTLLHEWLKEKQLNHKTADSIVQVLLKVHQNTFNNKMVEMMVSHKSYWDLKIDWQYLKVVCSPEAKKRIKEFVVKFARRKICLVLGDFNTRNILVNQDFSITAIDLEEVSYTDPAHDVGTILGHLLIFHYAFNTARKKEIEYIFDKYLKNINIKNKEELKKSIMMHIACILLCKIDGPVKFDFITKDIKIKLRELAEDVLLNEKKEIKCLLKKD